MTTSQILGILSLIIREALHTPRLERRPEPMTTMEEPLSVEAFHAQGAINGPLLPIYHFNALATSRLMPLGGTLVDLGSGSGQYLSYLARRRPDIRIIGLDLSRPMVTLGNRTLDKTGLKNRVDLQVSDMTMFSHRIPEQVSVISCVFALHHLPTTEHLTRCIREIVKVRERCGCGVWLFDHARPRHWRTAEDFPEIFTPETPAEFRQDSRNSLIASFSFQELSQCLDQTFMRTARHVCSSLIPLYQAHWLECKRVEVPSKENNLWVEGAMSPQAYRAFRQLHLIMRGVPLPRYHKKM